MKFRVLIPTAILVAATLTSTVKADVVQVTINGQIEFNQINSPPLSNGNSGDAATLTFLLESDNFLDSMSFPTRGYVIDEDSFSLSWGSETIAIQSPYPAGQTPYFVLRNNDPAVDGFFLSNNNVDFPIAGIPLEQTGFFEQFANRFNVTYENDPLDSLDILDAQGSYDFTGLSVFGWAITDGPFDAAFVIFENMTIESVAECFLVVGGAPGDSTFNPGHHVFDTQVDDVQAYYPVLLDDIPEFVIPTPVRGPHAAHGAGTATAGLQELAPTDVMQGVYTVQVLMWNPGTFPQLPEQFTYGLMVSVDNNGNVTTRPYGDSTGMEVWAETDVNEQGQHVVRFPFSIPGIDP